MANRGESLSCPAQRHETTATPLCPPLATFYFSFFIFGLCSAMTTSRTSDGATEMTLERGCWPTALIKAADFSHPGLLEQNQYREEL